MKHSHSYLLLLLATTVLACAVSCGHPIKSSNSGVRERDDDDASPVDEDDDDDNDDDDATPPSLGACCQGTSSCAVTPYEDCTGAWMGVDTTCAPNPCADDDDAAESLWTDTATGLIWQNGSTVGSVGYEQADAKVYCEELNWAGYTGWRLPDIDALRSLIRGCPETMTGGSCPVTDACLDSSCWSDACNGCSSGGGPGPEGAYWPPEISGVVDSSDWYWSSSAVADADGVGWIVYFGYDALVFSGYVVSNGLVRCVW
jgi:hypothetical protein